MLTIGQVTVGSLEFNVRFQHKYSYIRDDGQVTASYGHSME